MQPHPHPLSSARSSQALKIDQLAERIGIRSKPYRILTLDGGGVRGIIPVLWLERLEKYLGGPVRTHFDLIAGTSVGAILGCAFAQGMTATEVRGLWLDAARTAFAQPVGWRDRARRAAHRLGAGPQYDDANLTVLLQSVFGNRLFGELSRPTLALSCDPKTQQVRVFSSARAAHRGLPVWKVCRASAAAPLFFNAHTMVVDEGGAKYPLFDGGLTADNPVVTAVAEAVSTAFGQQHGRLDDVVVASFGTGEVAAGETTTPRTIFGHGSPVLRALLTGATGTDHVTARTMLPARSYWRFQTAISARLEPLDRIESIDELQAIALARLADGMDQRLGQLARRLQVKRLAHRPWKRATSAA
jgi:predicted acylesterase/phospholipase RssA